MNVLGTVKRVVGKLPSLGIEEDGEEEQNPYKRMLLREIKVVTCQTATLDEREKALVKIGHGGYTGDVDCHDILGPFVPKLVKMLSDEVEPCSLHIQCVRTLSEIVHFDRFIIDKTWKSAKFRQLLPSLIGDLDHPLMSRWACYLVSVMVAHSIAFLRELGKIAGFMDALETTAEFDHDWRGFNYDIANHLLVLSGKSTKTPTKTTEKKKKKAGSSISVGKAEVVGDKSVTEMKPLGRKWFSLGKGGTSPGEEAQGKSAVKVDVGEQDQEVKSEKEEVVVKAKVMGDKSATELKPLGCK